ncbi:hypothetical protein HFP57_13195 [Parasphingopyxis algicola]|uniref:hypothetical protein n=1 Tax=Parasphingopyxis algicola TaxID=2026624 RepID=UPI0015A27CA8|nr:hypothetical protein [Parasphingopyxis algicola]QLC25886.1 hypothetical protein HFP57_13195 [Parasphingopyxis algicola]
MPSPARRRQIRARTRATRREGDIVFLICIVAFLLLYLSMGWLARTYPEDERPKYIAQTLQAAITVVALIAAGSWYFFDRRTEPHAILDLEVTAVRLDENHALIEAKVIVENAGHTLLELERWDVRLLSVLPNTLCLLDIVALPPEYWPRTLWRPWIYFEPTATAQYPADCLRSDPVPRFYPQRPGIYQAARGFANQSELRFDRVRRFSGIAEHDIEPGERDIRIFDFVVRCDLEVARISATVQETDGAWQGLFGRNEENLWWKNRVLVSLADVCDGDIGALAVLHAGQG